MTFAEMFRVRGLGAIASWQVMKLYWSKRLCDLDVKRNASLANVRKALVVRGTQKMQIKNG